MLLFFYRLCVVVDRGADTLIQQAQGWESKGEYMRAIECYARVTPEVTSDANVLQRCWVKVSYFHSSWYAVSSAYSPWDWFHVRDYLHAFLQVIYEILNIVNIYLVSVAFCSIFSFNFSFYLHIVWTLFLNRFARIIAVVLIIQTF